jgi:probable phosphoglycerate mutase
MTTGQANGPAGETEEVSDPFLSMKNGGTEILLIRHADALPDAAEVVLDGAYNSQALSDLGRKQARALAERLRDVSLAAIYSSPIPRAHQTALPTAEALGLEVRIDDGLREVEIGRVGPDLPPGASGEDIARALRRRLNEIAAVALSTGMWASIPGSEGSEALRARATAAVGRLAAGHPGQRVAVVSHGGTINAYIAAMVGVARDYFFPCANTSISVVRIKGERRLLLGLNDIAHLQRARLA